MTSIPRSLFLLLLLAAPHGYAAECRPVETREANAPSQKPAFQGQTRACAASSRSAFEVVVVARGLDKPWAVEPLPGGDFLVTEKAGRLRIVSAKGEIGAPIAGVPQVDTRGQGGLLDVALSPQFAADRTIFFSYAEPRKGGNGTAVARAVLAPDRRSLTDVKVIFQAMPTYEGRLHYGSRLAFGPDGMLYVTTGDRSDGPMRKYAQQPDSHLGKVVRLRPDGGGTPEVWSLGHRNIQSAAVDAKGRLWTVEHGTRGGDELNLISKGKNYGWPLVSYGIEYSGRSLPAEATSRQGFEDPVYYWDPVIAPSGAEFYSGDAFPEWKGNLFIGALREKRLVRLVLDGDRVKAEEHLLTDRNQRVRDVRQGPDGFLYVVTDESNGELWRIAPKR